MQAHIEIAAMPKVPVDEALERLSESYEFEGSANVLEFLGTRPRLVSLLSNAVVPLRNAFGREPVLQLSTTIDWHDRWLSLGVLWKGSPDLAEAAMEDFDNSWWLLQPHEERRDLVINYWFV